VARENVRLGVGLHPWWLADGRRGERDVVDVETLLDGTAWVGEIGLDYSPKRGAHEAQLAAFTRICAACGEAGGKVMSIHAVRSADVVLDVLEKTGCTERCLPILHWFSGSTEALRRAIELGVHFSVNEMQASTRRAKEQLRLIPEELLLFETDLPPGEGVAFAATEIADSLARAIELCSTIRSAPRPTRGSARR
jgi:TatD DNase family protein